MPHRHQAAAILAARPTTPTTPEPEQDSSFDGKVRPSLQNTFRLESKRPWSEEAALQCLRDVMHEKLDAAEYDAAKCSELVASVAAEVRTRVRELNFDRYRIVCVVQVYEKLFQGIHAEVGYLWDTQRDRFASYSMSGLHIVASGTVAGVYYE